MSARSGILDHRHIIFFDVLSNWDRRGGSLSEHKVRLLQNQQLTGSDWYAIRTKANCETTSSALITAKGFEVYLPVYRARRRWSDRVKEIDVPLFPGYFFCRMAPEVRTPILSVPGVVGIVSAGIYPLPVNEQEVAAVRKLLTSGVVAGPWPFLREGQRVEVIRGPFAGLEGLLVKIKSQYRLVVSINLLQRSMAAEIESDWVRPKLMGRRDSGAPKLAKLA